MNKNLGSTLNRKFKVDGVFIVNSKNNTFNNLIICLIFLLKCAFYLKAIEGK